MGQRISKTAAGAAAAVAALGLGLGTVGTANAATPTWTSVGPTGVSGEITAVATVPYGGGRLGQWAFQSTANEDPHGYPSVYSRSDNENWAKTGLSGSKPGEVFVAAGAISNTRVLAFSNLRGAGGRVWEFSGGTWHVIHTFGAQIGGAKVLSATNVFVFGNTSGAGALGVWHYNGTAWTRIAATLQGSSADSSVNAWGYSGTTIGHWNGSKWTGTNVASLLPAKISQNAPYIVSVIKKDSQTAFAVATGGAHNYGGPIVVLYYNGRTWSRVGTYTGLGIPGANLVSLDRFGGSVGLWIPLYEPNGPSVLLHYSNGTFTKATLPAPATDPSSTINAITQIPHTSEQLAGGYVDTTSGQPPTNADILMYK